MKNNIKINNNLPVVDSGKDPEADLTIEAAGSSTILCNGSLDGEVVTDDTVWGG